MRRLTMDLIATGLSSLGQMLTFFLAVLGDSSPPPRALPALPGFTSSSVGVRVVQLEEDDPSILGVGVFEPAPLKGKLNEPISCNRLTEDDELVGERQGGGGEVDELTDD